MLATLALYLQTAAVGWQLHALTGSALDLGLVGLVQFVPIVALTLVALVRVQPVGGAMALLPIYARDILDTGP